jgi:hypothetical protein
MPALAYEAPNSKIVGVAISAVLCAFPQLETVRILVVKGVMIVHAISTHPPQMQSVIYVFEAGNTGT